MYPSFILVLFCVLLVSSACSTPATASNGVLESKSASESESESESEREGNRGNGRENTRESEELRAEIPQGWVKVADKKVGSLHVAEYFPQDTPEQWQQKLSIEALSGADLPDPLEFAQGLAAEQADVCNDFADNSIFAGFENGYPTVVHMMQCGTSKRTGKALLTMLKVIQGNKALYTITRIWRLEPSTPPAAGAAEEPDNANKPAPAKIAIAQDELAAWSATLRRIQVCDFALKAHACAAASLSSDLSSDLGTDKNP